MGRRAAALLKEPHRHRLRFEYCIVLRVKAASWKDSVLSRFVNEDKRMAEGREKAEAVLRSLREAGLTLKVKQHVSASKDKLLSVFITADAKRFERQSQRLAIERWLQQEGVGDTTGQTDVPLARPTRPTMRVVRVGGLHYFAPADGSRLSEQPDDSAQLKQLSGAAKVELIAHILRTPAAQGGADLPALRKSDRRGVILHVLPLHDFHFNRQLLKLSYYVNPWSRASVAHFLEQVRSQFGEKVAFYYAFNCFYTAWLLPPSVVGVALYGISFFGASQIQQLLPFFAAFIATWASCLLKAWTRYASRLALDWGVSNQQQSEEVRVDFYGFPRVSKITGEVELWYPQWRRTFKHCATMVAMLTQVLFMVGMVTLLYCAYFSIQSMEMSLVLNISLNLANSTCWGITLELLNWIVWYRLAKALTNFENHRTEQAHEAHLIMKLFVFFFIDCFLWFFILAFFHIPFGRQIDSLLHSMGFHFDKPFDRQVWMARLGQTIGAVLSITQWLMVFFADAYVPYFLKTRLKRRAQLQASRRRSSQPAATEMQKARGALPREMAPSTPLDSAPPAARTPPPAPPAHLPRGPRGQSCRLEEVLEQAGMEPYDPMLDYGGLVIQFGYVTMFSVAWPPAAAVCLLHSMFRLRSNTLRLTRMSMRPLPQAPTGGSAGIGLWQKLLMFEVWACILINCLIVAVSTDQLNYISCWTRSLLEKRPSSPSAASATDAGSGGVDSDEVCWHDVPMTSRFLIAVAAEHVLLVLVFLIFKAVPDQPPELRLKRMHAAFLFKKRYWESIEAEQVMAGGGTGLHSRPARLQPHETIDYDAEWRMEQELSDAYEDLGSNGATSGISGRARVAPATRSMDFRLGIA